MTAKRAMRAAQCVFFLNALLVARCPSAWATASLEDQAAAAWAKRDQPGQTEEAIKLWEKASSSDPEAQIHLTKAYGRMYRHAAPSERARWADRARESGAKAVKQFPNNSDAYAAYAEALGQWAQAHKGVHSLHAVRQAVDNLKKAIELKQDNAFAHMMLAEFYRQAPSTISVGDKKKALDEARLSVQYGPGYAINHLALAHALIDNGEKEAGIAELKKIETLTPPADAIPETHSDKETARQLLKSLGASDVSSASLSATASPCGDPSTGACTEQKP